MKAGWEIRAFDACVEKQKAPTKLLSSSYQEKGLYPIVSQEKDLISGYWDNPDDLFVHRKPVVVFGDHTMVVKYIDFDFVVGADGVKILEPKEFLLPKYFFYWVSSVHIKSRGYARHFRYLREANVPIPSLPEQQRIVDILDQEFAKIDALKANAEKSLQAAKDLFQETLHRYYSGKNALLGDVLNLRRGHDLTHSEMKDGSIPVAGSGGIIGYHSIATPISPCIAVGRSGSVGKVFVYETCWAHNTILYVDDFKGNNPYYLVYLLKSLNLTSYGGGSAVPTLNRNVLHPLPVGYTSNKKEQATIVACLDNLNDKCQTLQENYQKTLTLCDDLKQALLRKAFNGEL